MSGRRGAWLEAGLLLLSLSAFLGGALPRWLVPEPWSPSERTPELLRVMTWNVGEGVDVGDERGTSLMLLAAAKVFYRHFEEYRDTYENLVVVSPDVGNVKIANMYADMLNVDLAIIDKRRHSADVVESANIVGDVKGRTVLMVDDIISTAGTICSAANVVMEHGAKDVIAAATHAVLCGPAVERLSASPISRITVTNTIPRHTSSSEASPPRTASRASQSASTPCASPSSSPTRSTTSTTTSP